MRVPNSPLVAVDPQFFPPHYPPVMAVEDPSNVMDWPPVAPSISIPKIDDENPYGPESITASDPPEAFVTHPVIAPYYDPDGRGADLASLQQNGAAVQIVKPHNRGAPRYLSPRDFNFGYSTVLTCLFALEIAFPIIPLGAKAMSGRRSLPRSHKRLLFWKSLEITKAESLLCR